MAEETGMDQEEGGRPVSILTGGDLDSSDRRDTDCARLVYRLVEGRLGRSSASGPSRRAASTSPLACTGPPLLHQSTSSSYLSPSLTETRPRAGANMAQVTASPSLIGLSLPYSSLFAVPRRSAQLQRRNRRPPSYFWDRATSSFASGRRDSESPTTVYRTCSRDLDGAWLEDQDTGGISNSDDEEVDQMPVGRSGPASTRIGNGKGCSAGRRFFSSIRTLTFRSKVNGSPTTRTEIVTARSEAPPSGSPSGEGMRKSGSRSKIFESLRFRTKGKKTEVKRLVAVVKKRISSKSSEEEKPKTWKEYNQRYANVRLTSLFRSVSSPLTYLPDRRKSTFSIHLYLRSKTTLFLPLRPPTTTASTLLPLPHLFNPDPTSPLVP